MIALFGTHVPITMRIPIISLSVLLLAACSTTQLPISPHKIDVQQGNVIDQETVDKLKPGLTRSQVRFLLGTPLVVDPFRDNRWDYVYNYRKAGKLTEQKRLTLFFDRDVLSRIEAEGVETQGSATEQPGPPVTQAEPAAVKPASGAEPQSPTPVQPQPAASEANPAKPAPELAEKQAAEVAQTATSGSSPRPRTTVVPPLEPQAAKPAAAKPDSMPSPAVTLQNETDASAIKPDVMPSFPQTEAVSDTESAVLAAVRNWANAWSARDEEGYLAAYSDKFKPEGGLSKAEWEKRRRLLLNLSKNISVQVESPVVEFPGEGLALVTFNQHYLSDAHRDAVIKQLLLGRQDGRWLILEERVMPNPKAGK